MERLTEWILRLWLEIDIHFFWLSFLLHPLWMVFFILLEYFQALFIISHIIFQLTDSISYLSIVLLDLIKFTHSLPHRLAVPIDAPISVNCYNTFDSPDISLNTEKEMDDSFRVTIKYFESFINYHIVLLAFVNDQIHIFGPLLDFISIRLKIGHALSFMLAFIAVDLGM